MMRRLAILALLLTAAAPAPQSMTTLNRIRFVVRCVEESNGVRRTLYEADVDGPPGTDFTVRLRDHGFTLDALFVNEPTASGKLDVRSSLTTRRRHGTSSAGLPLWEEDAQEHRFMVGFDQEIEMLPFGGAGKAGLLKFDILPERSGGEGPMRIRIHDIHSNGAIMVDAFRQPHWYDVEAEIDGGSAVMARITGRIFTGTAGSMAMPQLGNLTITPRAVEHADSWRYSDITLGGRPFGQGSRAVVCRNEWQSFTIDPKRALRIRVAPEGTGPDNGDCP